MIFGKNVEWRNKLKKCVLSTSEQRLRSSLLPNITSGRSLRTATRNWKETAAVDYMCIAVNTQANHTSHTDSFSDINSLGDVRL